MSPIYLKALEIQGFKSFPDKTVLDFGEDITAIVGPNGSGKSNISDAIRWVMGEQNSRQLRGAKMEDVIFGGTETRNQMGFAQVTLVIDNTEHIFPARDEAEVAVTRRYYRSGESEYYINKQSVRLKDVNELFMDTGMGREGYSIIGQGKIDEILSVKSGERREIFEEAAGISKYRHRKEESERKLERTQENLVRINDKIAELELQVEPLRKQAETAKKYLVLRDELRVLEISVWLEQLQNIRAAKVKLEADTELAAEECRKAQTALDASYEEGERCGQQVRQNDMDAEALRAKVSGLETAAGEEESAMAVLRTGVAHNEESLRRLEQELADSDSRRSGIQSQVDGKLARVAEIDRQMARMQEQLDELLRQAQELADSAKDAAEDVETLRAQEAMAVAAAADGRAKLSAITAGAAEIAQRRQTVGQELAEAREKLENSEKESKENRRALRDAQEEAQAAENVIQGHSLRMDSRRKKAEDAAAAKLKLTMDAAALDDRIRLLTEMEKEYEGFSKAVKTVMQAAEKNALRGVHGPVAGLMTTKQEYALALEIALGAGMQNIVVDREEDAKAAIGFLKQRDGGRATFLPLTAIRGEELRDNVAGEYGFVGVASRLVTYDPQYDNIFRNLLGRTVVVEDLDSGIAMARKFRNGFRIVTLDGQVINRGGSMTGGSTSRSAGVLSRAAELERLNGRASEMHRKLEEAKVAEEASRRELDAAQYELATAETQRRAAEDEVLRLQGVKNQFDMLLSNLRESVENLAGEIEAIDGRIQENEVRNAAAEQTVADREGEAASCRVQAEAILSGQSELLAQSGQLSEAIAAHKAELAAIDANREGALRRAADLRTLAAELSGDRNQKEAALAQYQRQIEAAQTEIGQRRAEQAQLKAQSAVISERLAGISQEKIALEAERTAKSRAGQEMNETLLNLERAASRLETKLTTSAMEEKQILDKLWETYELNHSDAQAQRIELESVPKASRRVAELKREINGLGTINVGAIDEFERVNGRYTYLTDQRNDVEKAKGELTGIIGEITSQMTDIFGQQFKLLSESFEQTFVELFGGGQAKLELEDPEHILDCGIEIKAQPPGKALKTISLLSGGEKAFVAIALYFAILKVHPTPFCIMDEIEAALDEANVVRTARYMRTLADKTQFIVITHRRGTMEAADVLYGVTMQEQGVSKILTINLNDMAKELKIQ